MFKTTKKERKEIQHNKKSHTANIRSATNVSRQTITKRQPILQRPLFQTSDTILFNLEFSIRYKKYTLSLAIIYQN